VVLFRSLGERLAQLAVEPNGLDASRSEPIGGRPLRRRIVSSTS
jgi:hypothetical protein